MGQSPLGLSPHRIADQIEQREAEEATEWCQGSMEVGTTTYVCGMRPHPPEVLHLWPGERWPKPLGEREFTWSDVDEDERRSGDDRREAVDHPSHYGGEDNPYEVIKVLEAWGLTEDAYLFNVIKYLARAGKKGDAVEDHKKARWYLDRKIAAMTAGVDEHGVVR